MKWQYLVVELLNNAGIQELVTLNVHGNEGWELVAVVAGPDVNRYYFKRIQQ